MFLSIHLYVLFYSISILFQLLVFFLNIVNIFYTQIAGKDTLEELTSVEKDRIEEKLVSHGLSDVPLTMLNKDKAIRDLLSAEVIITRTLAMDSFFKGLDCMGLGKILRSYPTIIAPLIFPSPHEAILDPDQVKSSFDVEHVNNSEEEDFALSWFHRFIHDSASEKGKF